MITCARLALAASKATGRFKVHRRKATNDGVPQRRFGIPIAAQAGISESFQTQRLADTVSDRELFTTPTTPSAPTMPLRMEVCGIRRGF
jgi:hypothetical protein